MADHAIFKDFSREFLRKNDEFIDIALGHISLDIERYIKISAGTPVDTGRMKAAVTQSRIGIGRFRVVAPVEYSGVQEKGQRNGSQPFKNYTTPGTGAGWFQRSIDSVIKNRDHYIREAAMAVGL